MENRVSGAKLEVDPVPCTLSDIEICEKGVQQIWSVDENGDPDYLQETYSMEAYYAYYYCKNCKETFDTERDDFGRIGYEKEEEWEKVKEHLDGQL